MLTYRNGRFVEVASAKGAYVCWLLSHSSAALLNDWMKFVGVPDPTPEDELHATIMHCTGKGIDKERHGDYRMAVPYSDTSTGECRKSSILGKTRADGSLVVELMGARPLHQRHEHYRDFEGLNHSFPEFRPHVTLTRYFEGKMPKTDPALPEADLSFHLGKVCVYKADDNGAVYEKLAEFTVQP